MSLLFFQRNFKLSNGFSAHDNRHSFQGHGVYFGDVSKGLESMSFPIYICFPARVIQKDTDHKDRQEKFILRYIHNKIKTLKNAKILS